MNHDLSSQLWVWEISKNKFQSTIIDTRPLYSYTFKICTMKEEVENCENIACKVGQLHYFLIKWLIRNKNGFHIGFRDYKNKRSKELKPHIFTFLILKIYLMYNIHNKRQPEKNTAILHQKVLTCSCSLSVPQVKNTIIFILKSKGKTHYMKRIN